MASAGCSGSRPVLVGEGSPLPASAAEAELSQKAPAPETQDEPAAAPTEQSDPAPAAAPVALARTPEPEPIYDTRPRLYAPKGLIKIHDKPDYEAPIIGAFRAGQSVVLKDTNLPPERTLRRAMNCTKGWYPIEPRGFVCVGGDGHATRDPNDPGYIAAAAVLPDVNAAYPFKYGVSVGAPQYLRIPTKAEQRQAEPDLDVHLQNLPAADDKAGGAIDKTPAGRPASRAMMRYLEHAKPALLDAKNPAYEGYKVAWAQEFDANGRTWLVTADMTLIPKDRVRTKQLPTLKGINLKQEKHWTFPLAFTWLDDTTAYRMGEDGKLVETDKVIKRHTFLGATMEQAMGPGGIYWKMQSGDYIKYKDVTLIRKAKHRPRAVSKDDKWVEARVTWGYLIAYEGDEAVYVSAMSPGVDGINPRAHATARGKHYVDWKLISGDMSGTDKGEDWFVDEVPWVQYYKGNYALHGAWWHNNFGRPMSHGCVNLPPAAARELFRWMDPVIPEGWYAASAYYPYAKGTIVYVRP